MKKDPILIVGVLGRAAALREPGRFLGLQVLRTALACAGRFQKGGAARSPSKGAPQSTHLWLGTAQGE